MVNKRIDGGKTPIREASKKVEVDLMPLQYKSFPVEKENVVELGKNVKIYQFTNLYGCKIGDNTQIGTFVEIQRGAKIGKDCKISSHTFICDGVTIGDRCFIGHGIMFCNDKNPIVSDPNWQPQPILIEDDVSIGSGAVILPGVTIHKGALVGAGAIVTKDVPAGITVVGNPAGDIKRVFRRN